MADAVTEAKDKMDPDTEKQTLTPEDAGKAKRRGGIFGDPILEL
jgi:hypothetical protein